MNQLSWLLYWGNVAGNLGPLFGISATLCLVSCAGAIIHAFSGGYIHIKWILAPLSLAFFLGICAAFMPSQTTVYAIAASQMGEQALKTPIAGKATQALESWLDKQIAEKKD